MNIKDLIKELVKGSIPVVAFLCTVKTVDKNNESCDVEMTDGTLLMDVRLRSVIDEAKNGLLVVPLAGSKVLVSMIDNKLEQCYVTQYSEVECIIYQGGTNGGMVKVEELVARLNKLEERMTSHQHIYVNSAGTPTPTVVDGSSNVTIMPTKATDLENPKFKH